MCDYEFNESSQLKGFAYIDFETSKNCDFYMVGTQVETRKFKQIVLTEKLQGLATQHNLRVMRPVEFAGTFCTFCLKHGLIIAAYSEAEKNILKKLTNCEGLQYLNLNKAAKQWRNRYKRFEFNNLPNLAARQKIPNYMRRELRNSLFSVSRLLNDSQTDGLNIPKLTAYGYWKTSTRFRAVIDALSLHQQNYSKLTGTQKAKGTKALNHNRFDVQVLPRLHATIKDYDDNIITSSTSNLNGDQDGT